MGYFYFTRRLAEMFSCTFVGFYPVIYENRSYGTLAALPVILFLPPNLKLATEQWGIRTHFHEEIFFSPGHRRRETASWRRIFFF